MYKKKKKDEDYALVNATQTVQPTTDIRTVDTVNSTNQDGYTLTGKKYGDYKYQDYVNKKDYNIYKKDNKSYYFDEKNKKYVDIDMPTMTSAEQDKKDYEKAVKNGYVGDSIYKGKKQVQPTKISDRVNLETSDLTDAQKKKYAKSLIRQEKERDADLAYVRKGGAGLSGTIGELQNVGRGVDEAIIEPISRAPESYQLGKLNQQLSQEYYKKMIGKNNDAKIDDLNRQISIFNQFNNDVVQSNNQLDTYFKNLPNEVSGITSGIKGGGALGAIGAIGGGAIGLLTTKDPATVTALAQKGAQLLGGAGYVTGQAKNTFELEAGAEYQALLEMGVPDDIARKEALRVGTENALIESGESILDLVTLGKSSVAIDKLKAGLLKKYGSDVLKNWGVSYLTNVASEAGQEALQEDRSIAGEKRAAEKAGIERDSSQDISRRIESAKSGALGAILSGGATKTLGLATNTAKNSAFNMVNNNINNRQANTNINNQQIQQQKSVANETQVAPQTATQTEEISEQVQASPDAAQSSVDNIQQTQTTANNVQSTAENKRIIGNRDFSSEKYKNLSDSDLQILNNLYDKYKNKAEMTPEEINQMQYLRKKINNVKNPELKTENTFEEVKKDLGKTKLDDYDSTMVDNAKEMVQANRQGKRTKQQWLDIAENIGLQAENMDSESLKKLALQSFKAERPNVKDNLNRQGKGFVDFKANEWVNAVYKGAKVGKKLQQPEQTTKNLQNISNTTKENIPEEKAKDNVIVAKNSSGKEIKLKQNKDTGIYTREDSFNRDLKDINQQFKNQTIAGKNGQKISNFYSNITEKSQFIDTDIRNMFKNENDIKFYNKVTNEESLNKANAEIGNTAQSQEKAFNDFISKKEQFDATDMAKGWIFLSRFNEARDYDRAYLVAKQMREMGTKSGQAIQMLNLQSRLTPEGMYRWAVNELIQAENAFNSEKGRTKKEIEKYRDSFKLTPEETEFIKTQMEKVQNMEDGREKQIEIAKVNSMLSDKLPHKKGQSLKAWMRISMLLNPKTQVRNVVGNAIITPVNTIVDAVAGSADRLVARKTGQRTIGGPSVGGAIAYGKGAVKGLKEATQDYKLGIDTKNINQNRFDIGQGKAFNENHSGPLKGLRNKVAKGLNATNDFLGFVMDAGDRAFYNGSVENSLYNQQKLNNTNEITKDMADIAEMEGLQRTWNDNNDYTKAVLNLRKAINTIGDQIPFVHFGEYGLGDLLIPFAKTPANLTKAIVDYSPIGFINTITEGKNLKNAVATGNYTPQMQHDFSQSLGKAVAGTLLYTLGIGLAKAGITTGDSDDDKDLKNFMRYNLGIQPYSIKVGNKSFTYDWAQPIASPFAITADIEKGLDENMTPEQAIQHFLTTGFNILSEQSFLSGINEVLNNNDGVLEGIQQQVSNIPATAIPTFLKQITDMLDGTKRQTYSKEGQAENTRKTEKSKLPILSETLAPQVDVLGNEIQKYGGDNSFFNVFINPANTEKGKPSPVAEEIYSLYQATQDKTLIPRKVDFSTKINGENKILTTKEMEKWQKASGKMVNEEVGKAINDSDYKKLTTEQKADVVNKIVNYSYQKSKSETFNTPLAKLYNGVEKARQKGIPIYDYYISKVKEK